MSHYGLYGDFDVNSANQIVSSIDSTMSSVLEIRQAQEEYKEKLRENKLAKENARTQREIDAYQSWIDYYQYITDELDKLIKEKKEINRANNIKRVLIFGGAIAVSLLLVASAYKRTR